MNSKPVSILLPVYNGEKFIMEAIDSIFKNSYQNFEIVLIDDGSTDNTVPLIKKFKDDRIHLFKKSNSKICKYCISYHTIVVCLYKFSIK